MLDRFAHWIDTLDPGAKFLLGMLLGTAAVGFLYALEQGARIIESL